jgi:hypothetical protein
MRATDHSGARLQALAPAHITPRCGNVKGKIACCRSNPSRDSPASENHAGGLKGSGIEVLDRLPAAVVIVASVPVVTGLQSAEHRNKPGQPPMASCPGWIKLPLHYQLSHAPAGPFLDVPHRPASCASRSKLQFQRKLDHAVRVSGSGGAEVHRVPRVG